MASQAQVEKVISAGQPVKAALEKEEAEIFLAQQNIDELKKSIAPLRLKKKNELSEVSTVVACKELAESQVKDEQSQVENIDHQEAGNEGKDVSEASLKQKIDGLFSAGVYTCCRFVVK